jgi:hypothetical protein
MEENRRYFTIVNPDGTTRGRFSGDKPKQACSKALTYVMRDNIKNGGDGVGEINITLRECTKNSERKLFHYIGKREKLDKPIEVFIGENKEPKLYYYANKITINLNPHINEEQKSTTTSLSKNIELSKTVESSKTINILL